MLIPRFWAEASLQHRSAPSLERKRKPSIVLRRFGWSNESQEAAQAHAEMRVREAMEQVLRGNELPRKELKWTYGTDGLPIREEIVAQQGEAIITRNSYGVRCLNTPNVLFADVDFDSCEPPEEPPDNPDDQPAPKAKIIPGRLVFLSIVSMGLIFGPRFAGTSALAFLVCALWIFFFPVDFPRPGFSSRSHRTSIFGPWLSAEQIEKLAHAMLERFRQFAQSHPDWNIRLYRSPGGFRLMVTHRSFLPSEPEVLEFFKATGTDPKYQAMCLKQQCFRARVSAKPWNINPNGAVFFAPLRGGVWPVAPARMEKRRAWIEQYEIAAQPYAACTFIESLGSGMEHPEIHPVREWHDKLCRALDASLPLA
ncbi:MAG: hypothetical protein LBB76_11830 [Azoarcus sp.]|jgi:hypothetical protein|nr:hypothetical protein [Azoarcus sp.]